MGRYDRRLVEGGGGLKCSACSASQPAIAHRPTTTSRPLCSSGLGHAKGEAMMHAGELVHAKWERARARVRARESGLTIVHFRCGPVGPRATAV